MTSFTQCWLEDTNRILFMLFWGVEERFQCVIWAYLKLTK